MKKYVCLMFSELTKVSDKTIVPPCPSCRPVLSFVSVVCYLMIANTVSRSGLGAGVDQLLLRSDLGAETGNWSLESYPKNVPFTPVYKLS